MDVTAEHAGGAVVLELDEGCRSVAALRRVICAALPDLKEDGFDITVQGRPVEDVDVRGLEEGATIRVVASRRAAALAALRAARRSCGERGLKRGMLAAVGKGDVALCEQYLDAGVSPDLCEEGGGRYQPLIHLAFNFRRLEVCELLLSRGCDVNAFVSPYHDETPLWRAAETGLPEFCALFLQHGADVHMGDRECRSPLHRCVYDETEESYQVREVLLIHGANMRRRSAFYVSPLDCARRRRRRCVRISPFNALDQFVKHGLPQVTSPRYLRHLRTLAKQAKMQFKRRRPQRTREMRFVSAFVTDVLTRMCGEAGRVTSFSGAQTLSAQSVVAAVKLQLPEELATHALAAGDAGSDVKNCGGCR